MGMTPELLVFLTGTLFGTITLHASNFGRDNGAAHKNRTTLYIHLLSSVVSMPALTIWGFVYLSWWIPIVGFIAIFQILRLIVKSSNWERFFKVIPVTGGFMFFVTASAWAWKLFPVSS